MKLIIESPNIDDYLAEIPPIITFNTPMISQEIEWIKEQTSNPEKQARIAFEIARDDIFHSFDTKHPLVTINAEDVLKSSEGICFSKSHLLVALLRGLSIPAGFCYQRVLRVPTDENSGFALHGLNAIYLREYGWFRVDPRGNKPGVNSQFSIEPEQLAYTIHPHLGEVDYPTVYAKPLDSVIQSMQESATTQELFFNRPDSI